MKEEKMRILEMLQDGKINAEETEKLLAALGEEESLQAGSVQTKNRKVNDRKSSEGIKKHLRIIVNEDGKENVNISLPLGIAKSLLNFVPQSAKEKIADRDIDLDALIKTIDELSEEKEILRVDDENETVIIRVE